jgi:hypothetical protein
LAAIRREAAVTVPEENGRDRDYQDGYPEGQNQIAHAAACVFDTWKQTGRREVACYVQTWIAVAGTMVELDATRAEA